MFDWFKRLWSGSSGNALARKAAEDSQTVTFMITESGEVPSLAFQGDDLDKVIELSAYSYACITANAETASSLQWQAQVLDDEGNWLPDRDHPVNEVLQRPVQGLPLAWKGFVETLCLQHYAAGNMYLRPLTNRSTRLNGAAPGTHLTGFDLFHPGDIKTETRNRKPVRYRYMPRDGEIEEFSPSELVHIMNASASSQACGPAPLRAAQDAVTIDSLARRRQKSNLENRVSPGFIVKIPGVTHGTTFQSGATGPDKSIIPVHHRKRTALEDRLRESYGVASAEGKPMVLDPGMEIAELPSTDQHVQYIDTRKLSKQEIKAIFRTPPWVIGDGDAASLGAGAAVLERVWWQLALLPLLMSIAQAINAQAIQPLYGPRVRLWYAERNSPASLVLMVPKLDAALKIVKLGYPPAVAAQHVGLELPHIDELENPLLGLVLAGRLALEDAGGESGGERNDGAEMDASLQEEAEKLRSRLDALEKQIGTLQQQSSKFLVRDDLRSVLL